MATTGGSKATIYKYFGSKQGLFFAICLERCNRFTYQIEQAFEQHHSDFRLQLHQLLNALFVVFSEEQSTAFAKLLVQVSQENPDISQELYNVGPKKAQMLLAKYLQKAHDQQQIFCSNPHVSANYLLGFFHNFHWRITIGLPALEDNDQTRNHIGYIVERFIEGHQPPKIPFSL
jgi:TetR/AcrR family transcriptional repressor of adeIJK operon